MGTHESVKLLIDRAAAVAGNQAKLARILEIPRSHITDMKKGIRPANWRIRGGLRAILGEDPAAAFMAAIAEDLEQPEKEDEKKPPTRTNQAVPVLLQHGAQTSHSSGSDATAR